MPETTDTLRWTALRHRMLREVATGEAKVYVGLDNHLIHPDGGWYRGGEKRQADLLRKAWTYASYPGSGAEAPAKLTDAGRALLSRWDAEHPEGGERHG